MLFALCLLGVSIGVLRYEFYDKAPLPVDGFAHEGIVITEPDVRDNYQRLVVRLGPEGEKLLITTHESLRVSYGDKLHLAGEAKPPVNRGDFDWVSYLRKDRIHYELFYPEVKVLESGQGNFVKQKLFAVKKLWLSAVARVLPEPHSSLAGGLIVGAKESLGEELLDDFRQVGLMHIVVLSGYNIMIIAVAIGWLFSKLFSKQVAIAAAVVSIILFVMLVGAGPSVLRAGIMAVLGLLALSLGRRYEVTRALVLAALVMVFINPAVLVYDAGFQLSFIATLGIIYLVPLLTSKLPWLPELAATTIAAQISVAPLLLYKMGELSLVALPVNLLVLPVVPFAMLFGFVTGSIAIVAPVISYPFAWFTYLSLEYIFVITDLFAALPFASVLLY